MFIGALVKCEISPKAMQVGEVVSMGKQVKLTIDMQSGIEQDLSKKIIKRLKQEKLKVQSQMQGDQLRITGKKRDDLQQAMAIIRDGDFDQAMQFKNFRDWWFQNCHPRECGDL